MANYDANKIRNIVFLGHQSAGKTSLVESLYFLTGGTNQKGEVEKRTPLVTILQKNKKEVPPFKPLLSQFIKVTLKLT